MNVFAEGVGLLMFRMTLRFLGLLASWPCCSLTPPWSCWCHLFTRRTSRSCKSRQEISSFSRESLGPPSASKFAPVFSQQTADSAGRDAPEWSPFPLPPPIPSSQAAPAGGDRRGCRVVQVSVELRLHCFPSRVCQRAGVSVHFLSSRKQFVLLLQKNCARSNNLSCVSIEAQGGTPGPRLYPPPPFAASGCRSLAFTSMFQQSSWTGDDISLYTANCV